MPLFDPRLAFRLGQQKPLAVEVEPIVIGSRFDPHIVRFVREIGVLAVRPEGFRVIDPPRMSVGIEGDRKDHHRIVQLVLNNGALRSREVIEQRDRRIH